MNEDLNAVFWLSLASIVIGGVGLTLKFCLKSKCQKFKCCYGLVSIDRNVELEVKEEIERMEMGITESKSDRDLQISKL
jgi:hypothetical protein